MPRSRADGLADSPASALRDTEAARHRSLNTLTKRTELEQTRVALDYSGRLNEAVLTFLDWCERHGHDTASAWSKPVYMDALLAHYVQFCKGADNVNPQGALDGE